MLGTRISASWFTVLNITYSNSIGILEVGQFSGESGLRDVLLYLKTPYEIESKHREYMVILLKNIWVSIFGYWLEIGI